VFGGQCDRPSGGHEQLPASGHRLKAIARGDEPERKDRRFLDTLDEPEPRILGRAVSDAAE
jgi:hypothetical protein